MVLVGAADALSRAARVTFGADANSALFAPAVTIGNRDALNAAIGTTNAFVPARIVVPSVGIDAAVEPVGVRADGAMQTPKKFEEVAWYALGGLPGGTGNAVFAGHVNNALTQSGVFAHAGQMNIGDYINVADKDGHTMVYRVQAIDQYSADEPPPQSLFTTSGPTQLVLITCDGDWIPAQKSFDKRLVITATPAYR